MNASQALQLVQHWGRDSRDMRYIGQMQVAADGGFLTMARGAFLRYEANQRTLLVSALVRYKMPGLSLRPSFVQKLTRTGERERTTLGEGEFEFYTQPLFDFEPEVVLLTKPFRDGAIDPAQFSREVRWLLRCAQHWRIKRFNDVLGSAEEDLIPEGQRIVSVWPARPW
ncbi:MAG: hypothetical protein LW854_17845 [Rubrivivax sp.]|jgi:hypothetical protein|nr:hypothetical protein [Rubrivivax sp.]